MAAGACETLASYHVGTRVTVAEALPPHTQLTGLTLTPAAAGTTDPTAGTASVVVGTDVATLTFTNRSTTQGAVVVCKVAGSGIAPGTTASFAVTDGANTPLTAPLALAAGPVPAGTCSAPIVAPAGEVRVTETLAPNTAVAGTPLVSPVGANLGGSQTATTFTYRVQVTAAQTTTVTFTNVAVP